MTTLRITEQVDLQLSVDGVWQVVANGQTKPCVESMVMLLPLLERDWAEVEREMANLGESHFPRDELVILALTSESDYWASLGVSWLKYCDPLGGNILAALQSLVVAKWADQDTRHSARKLLP